MQQVFRDANGNALMTGILPEDFKVSGRSEVGGAQLAPRLNLSGRAERKGCLIGFQNGENYIMEKKKVEIYYYMQPEQKPQNEVGAWYAKFVPLQQQLDAIAAQLSGKKLTGKYYDLSAKMKQKLQEEFQRQLNNTVEESQIGLNIASIGVSMIIRNYLQDGGLGVYENGGRLLAVCLTRVGVESETCQGYRTIQEELVAAPFGQAPVSYNAITAAAGWDIPLIYWLETDSREDLDLFVSFVESAELTPKVRQYMEQLRQYGIQQQAQRAQLDAMQTQQMIGAAWEAQQRGWAASDRLRESLSRDLDSFHQNLNSQMASFDARIMPDYTQAESLDDRIQRGRHESMMGVDTWQREDGSEVEFSNRADRVFENNLDSTSHFGTERYFGDYVPEGWHELKRK